MARPLLRDNLTAAESDVKKFHLNMHHVYGVAFVGLGALVSHQDTLRQYMTPTHFGLATMGIGIGVSIFGFLSGQSGS